MASRELISPEGLRSDGRRAHELRRIAIRLGAQASAATTTATTMAGSTAIGDGGVVADAVVPCPSSSLIDGQAYYSQGHTAVLAFIHGPREVEMRTRMSGLAKPDRAAITCTMKMATFSGRERKQITKIDRRATELSILLRQSFESVILTRLYPGCQIDIHVHVLQNDGGVLAASVNAITLALQNAGVAMTDMLCACTVGLADNIPIIDLNTSERSSDTPELSLATLAHSREIVLLQHENKMPLQSLQEMIALAMEGNQRIYTTAKEETQRYSETILRSRGVLS